mmetsp:Transcript_28280/g.65162  ORF Transcript_28280/g.65162 Transcript_28280/m.65162 type:complete len:247 (-) Transcript_28280:1489-2229(-)
MLSNDTPAGTLREMHRGVPVVRLRRASYRGGTRQPRGRRTVPRDEPRPRLEVHLRGGLLRRLVRDCGSQLSRSHGSGELSSALLCGTVALVVFLNLAAALVATAATARHSAPPSTLPAASSFRPAPSARVASELLARRCARRLGLAAGLAQASHKRCVKVGAADTEKGLGVTHCHAAARVPQLALWRRGVLVGAVTRVRTELGAPSTEGKHRGGVNVLPSASKLLHDKNVLGVLRTTLGQLSLGLD